MTPSERSGSISVAVVASHDDAQWHPVQTCLLRMVDIGWFCPALMPTGLDSRNERRARDSSILVVRLAGPKPFCRRSKAYAAARGDAIY
jgi:hypothetical protein